MKLGFFFHPPLGLTKRFSFFKTHLEKLAVSILVSVCWSICAEHTGLWLDHYLEFIFYHDFFRKSIKDKGNKDLDNVWCGGHTELFWNFHVN